MFHSRLRGWWLTFLVMLVILPTVLGDDDEETGEQCRATSDPSYFDNAKRGGGRFLITATLLLDNFLDMFTQSWFLFPAILMVLHRHVFMLFNMQYFHWCWVMGRSFVILHIWMNAGIPALIHKSPFVSSCTFIFLDQVVVWAVIKKLKEKGIVRPCSDTCRSSSQPILCQRIFREEEKMAGNLEADNIYQDLRVPFKRCVLTCFAQMGLIMYYVFELNGLNTQEDDDDNVYLRMIDPDCPSLVKWLLAVVITEIVQDDDTGKKFGDESWLFWTKVEEQFYRNHETREADECSLHHAKDGSFLPLWTHLYARCLMDMLINSMMFTMIMTTAPIMLSVEQPLDYVKDVTAVFFILKLDDIDDAVDLSNAEVWKTVKTLRVPTYTWLGFSKEDVHKAKVKEGLTPKAASTNVALAPLLGP
mmetsp:Transcript_83479/g.145114  ORF Transcript_83479/g.145114 Transcript_83479/m.145114 type:complete len:418 (-) Transcript_83479:142-1395(-)